MTQALEAQRKSIVLLHDDKAVLPWSPEARVYTEGLDATLLTARGFAVAATPQDGGIAVLRVTFAQRPGGGGRGAGARGPGR